MTEIDLRHALYYCEDMIGYVTEISLWTHQIFGAERDSRVQFDWGTLVITFAHEDDAIMFRLKFGV